MKKNYCLEDYYHPNGMQFSFNLHKEYRKFWVFNRTMEILQKAINMNNSLEYIFLDNKYSTPHKLTIEMAHKKFFVRGTNIRIK